MKKIINLFQQRNKALLFIFVLALLIRLAAIIPLGNINNAQMWEFGTLAKNFMHGYGYSYNIMDVRETVFPPVASAHMPPGLVFIFIALFKIFGETPASSFAFLLFNSLLASISCIVIFLISEKIYNLSTAVLSGLFAALAPVYIFSAMNFNSIIIYQLLLGLIFLYFLKADFESENILNIILLSVSLGLILYFRSEMLLFMLLIALILLLKKRYLKSAAVVVISVLILMPWIYRNYDTFGRVIPTTTSFGLNFYIGHNPQTKGSQWLNGTNQFPAYWTDELGTKLKPLPMDNNLEINAGRIATDEALIFIKENPGKEAVNSARKIFYLWIMDPNNPKSLHPLYFIPWFITLILFIAGFYFSLKDSLINRRLLLLKVYLLMTTAVVIAFFTIARYQVQMSYIMIPTAMYGLVKLYEKYKNKISG